MTVAPAKITQIKAIESLLQRGKHVYTFQPLVDLEAILKQQPSVVGSTVEQLWGFASLEGEARPKTLAEAAPDRFYLAQVALARGRSPFTDVPELVNGLVNTLVDTAEKPPKNKIPLEGRSNNAILLIYYGHQQWLVKPLEQAGFAIVERVELLTLDRLQRRTFPTSNGQMEFSIRLAQWSDLDAIADLDAVTFSPLWHLGLTQFQELWETHRFHIMVDGEDVIGYTAMALVGEDKAEQSTRGQAHLARIATLPAYRGKGAGRELLFECLQFAQQQGIEAVTLSMQTDNETARALYGSAGFSRTGQIYPVLTRLVTVP